MTGRNWWGEKIPFKSIAGDFMFVCSVVMNNCPTKAAQTGAERKRSPDFHAWIFYKIFSRLSQASETYFPASRLVPCCFTAWAMSLEE